VASHSSEHSTTTAGTTTRNKKQHNTNDVDSFNPAAAIDIVDLTGNNDDDT
jgi:hypothetical protein